MTATEAAFWGLALIGHGALWVEIVNRLHGLGWDRRLIDAGTAFCGLAVAGLPLVGLVAWLGPGTRPTPAWLGAYACAAALALTVIVAMRLGLRWDPQRDAKTRVVERRELDLGAKLGERAATPRIRRLAALPGNRVLRPVAEELRVPLEGLPEALEGLRVAHLTDLHMAGRLGIDYFREVVAAVNDWGPDLVCVTGDVVEHPPQLDWVGPTLGTLRAGLGSFFVLGNHDAKVDSDDLRRRLAEAGLVDAVGRVAVVRRGGGEVNVLGDERPWFGGEPPAVDHRAFSLCLAHTPDRFGWAARRGIDLVLAGHNHGGQVCFPGVGALLCPSVHGVRYASGTFRRGRTVMHVSRGAGALFPLRYLCPPEIALLTLTRA